MSFSDLLKAPLPSKMNSFQESADDLLTPPAGDTTADEPVTITPSLEQPKDVSESNITSQTGAVMPSVDDPTPELNANACSGPDCSELTPDESRRVDDTMNTVATTMLIASALDEEEIKEFVESFDAEIAISEGFLTEKTIVKFDKEAKWAQLYEVALRSVAREKNDPLYRKLETVYKMERILRAKLRKKYHSQATAKAKEYLARAKKSKSGILSRIAKKIAGK